MKSFIKLLGILTCTFTFLFVSSCNNGTKQIREYSYEERVCAQDTADVKELIASFFNLAISNNYDEAAAMLYRINPDVPKGEPILLNNEEMAEIIALLQTFPPIDYNIEYLKFTDGYENEALCRVLVSKGENGMPDFTTKMFFRPMNYLGKWSLSIMNTSWGDKGIVPPSQRDSIARVYNSLQKDSI